MGSQMVESDAELGAVSVPKSGTEPLVTILTGCTGHPGLRRCVQSVLRQQHSNFEHLLVIDGPEREAAVRSRLAQLTNDSRQHVIVLPYVTGKDRWNGHRIYGAFPSIARGEYICYLDEDNFWESSHLSGLLKALNDNEEVWGFSLRNICLQDGTFVTRDECESLGFLHAVFYDDKDFLVDTSCYIIRRDIAVELCGVWNRPARPPAGQAPADRTLYRRLSHEYSRGACTRCYTVNYCVGNRNDSVAAAAFILGNRTMRERYSDRLPWEVG
jgi:glycosyltransferase involved in cell wall biosynthesis